MYGEVYSQTLLQYSTICTVWVKKIPPKVIWIFLFFHKRLSIFIDFLHTYYTFLCTLEYKFLFNYLQVWRSYAILSETTYYLVHIICAKCPPSAETHAFRRLRKLLIALLIVVCSHYKINTFIMSTNMSDMALRQKSRHLLSKQT